MFRETKITTRQLNIVLKNAKFHSVKELTLMSELTVSVVNTILKTISGKSHRFSRGMKKAFAEDREKAIRILFYLRDVRSGCGERTLFRNCLRWLGTDYSLIFEKIIGYISEYGRFDDMFFDNPKCFEIINAQLKLDSKTDIPSLLSKWLPTINASSSTTRAKARFMAGKLGLRETEYRKTLRGISLRGISLRGISLRGISLRGISLRGISLRGISLRGIRRLWKS